MTDVTGTLLKHRKRLNEIAGALARHGLAAWRRRGGGIADFAPIENLVHRVVSEEDISASTASVSALRWRSWARLRSSSARC